MNLNILVKQKCLFVIVYTVKDLSFHRLLFFLLYFFLGHHQHGTRIMHEFFIGKKNTKQTLTEPKSPE